MSESIIAKKSFEFSVKHVLFYKKFVFENKELVLSRQLLRSGTSIGANVREGINAQSKMDFIHKLSISQMECDETIYWLDLLFTTDYISEEEYLDLKNDATELLKILRSIIITTKKNMQSN